MNPAWLHRNKTAKTTDPDLRQGRAQECLADGSCSRRVWLCHLRFTGLASCPFLSFHLSQIFSQ